MSTKNNTAARGSDPVESRTALGRRMLTVLCPVLVAGLLGSASAHAAAPPKLSTAAAVTKVRGAVKARGDVKAVSVTCRACCGV